MSVKDSGFVKSWVAKPIRNTVIVCTIAALFFVPAVALISTTRLVFHKGGVALYATWAGLTELPGGWNEGKAADPKAGKGLEGFGTAPAAQAPASPAAPTPKAKATAKPSPKPSATPR